MHWLKVKKNVTCLIFYTFAVFSLLLFLHFFISLHGMSKKYIISEDSGETTASHNRKKLVLFIIDGLRYDQVLLESEHHMPFIASSIAEGRSCLLKTRVQPPTVTMPRIKAITSGVIPSFSDVILNLASPEFLEDTFIRQAQLHQLTTAFYGDNTWLKMFPNRFSRSEGVHSFFANDFTEVDHNVTKKLDAEAANGNQWDLLVLHYLGLDHLGHTEGPRGRHVAEKLYEMDNILRKLTVDLDKDGLVLLTGDHGTKDSGGHGGVTLAEVIVPLVSVNKSCHYVPGWPKPGDYVAQQIDLASTISILLNLPIPAGNTGKPIPALLADVPLEIVLDYLMSVKQTLLRHVNSERFRGSSGTEYLYNSWKKTKDANVVDDLGQRLFKELSDISDALNRNKTDFNVPMLFLSSGLLVAIFFISLYILKVPLPQNVFQYFLALGSLAHTLSLLSTSLIEEEHQTWYFMWATLVVVIFVKYLRSERLKKCQLFYLIALASIHRLLRILNQTGDKWASEPDLTDYFIEHPSLLALAFFLGLVTLWILFALSSPKKRFLPTLNFTLCLICIMCYRLTADNSLFPSIFRNYPRSNGNVEVNIFFVLLITLALQKVSMVWLWSLISGLTQRPANLMLVAFQILVSKLIEKLVQEDDFWLGILYTWIGQIFYFYQGNSNSLANVDVAASFIGCDEYNVFYATIMMSINTFSSQVLAFLLSPQTYSPIFLTYLLPLSVYVPLVTFQRHHLFIWSVFAPKLLISSASFIALFFIVLSHCVYMTIIRVRN